MFSNFLKFLSLCVVYTVALGFTYDNNSLKFFSNNNVYYKILQKTGILEPFPLMKYIAAIKWRDFDTTYAEGHICSAAIVSRSQVLAAAHCGLDTRKDLLNVSNLIVAAGYTTGSIYDEYIQIKNVRNIIIHAGHKNALHNMDLALFVLDDEFSLQTGILETISIASNGPKPYDNCSTLGFGVMYYESMKLSQKVRSSLEIWPQNLCRSYLIKFNHLVDDKFCAGEMTTFDEPPCETLASEPLICNDVVYGVSIFNIGCDTMKGFAVVFANLEKFHHWLADSSGRKVQFSSGRGPLIVSKFIIKTIMFLIMSENLY